MFPSEEAGNYFNPNYVFIKYDLDIADPDKIKETYDIAAYPTFIILDESGTETARVLGGASDAASFVKRIEEGAKPENSLQARYAKFKSDPSTAIEYLKFLEDCYMKKEADKVLADLLNERPVAETFAPERMEYMKSKMTSPKSAVFITMVAKQAEVEKVIGKEVYAEMMQTSGAEFIMGQIYTRKFNSEAFDEVLAEIAKNPLLQSDFTKFVAANKQLIIDKNAPELMKLALPAIAKCKNAYSRESIVNVATAFVSRKDREAYNKAVLPFLEEVVKRESDPKYKSQYEKLINNIKNPPAMPAMRMN